MADVRMGRQTPTQSVILPYIQTKGVRLVRACGSKPAFKAASL